MGKEPRQTHAPPAREKAPLRQPSSSVFPETEPHREPPHRSRAPVVERIAGWSARHRKTAVLGWLVLVAAVFVAGHMLPATNVPAYDAGQSGQAEQTLHRLGVSTPPRENVLIQQRGSAGPQRTFATDPDMRQAVRQAEVTSVPVTLVLLNMA